MRYSGSSAAVTGLGSSTGAGAGTRVQRAPPVGLDRQQEPSATRASHQAGTDATHEPCRAALPEGERLRPGGVHFFSASA